MKKISLRNKRLINFADEFKSHTQSALCHDNNIYSRINQSYKHPIQKAVLVLLHTVHQGKQPAYKHHRKGAEENRILAKQHQTYCAQQLHHGHQSDLNEQSNSVNCQAHVFSRKH